MIDTNELAAAIRLVDGDHSLGAGALAEAILAETGPLLRGYEIELMTRVAQAEAWEQGYRDGAYDATHPASEPKLLDQLNPYKPQYDAGSF
jgi:hypothetical protein